MNDGNFEINKDDFDKAEEMDPILMSAEGSSDQESDFSAEIEALEFQIHNLKTQPDSLEANQSTIDNLEKQLQTLRERQSNRG